jgi:hypothetical protein
LRFIPNRHRDFSHLYSFSYAVCLLSQYRALPGVIVMRPGIHQPNRGQGLRVLADEACGFLPTGIRREVCQAGGKKI